MIFDLAYVGSKSTDLLRQQQINAVPRGATFLAAEPGPDARAERDAGRHGAARRPAAALPGLRQHPHVGLQRLRATTTRCRPALNRRFENGFMFSAFYVWSKALDHQQRRLHRRASRTSSEEEIRRVDYSYANYDRPHNFVVNFIYQTPKVASGVLGALANDWQLSGIYRWTSGRPVRVNYSIPGIGAANLVGNDGNPNARIVLTVRPGQRLERRSLPADQHLVLRPAAAGQRRRRVGPLLPARARRSTTSTCRSPRRSRSASGSGSRCASTRSTRSTTRSSPASTPRRTSRA